MNNTIEIVKTTDCYGCGACDNICPASAITINYDERGFLKPIVDHEKCTNCGLCVKACPSENPKFVNSETPPCYAIKANDDIRYNSSSGGAFTLLYEVILKKGGYVAGVVLDTDFSAKHIVTNELSEIEKMRGSKYIQSRTDNVYKDIKELLKKDIWVLYTGTPCQVAGLYGYLGRDYDTLVTVDLVCHGTPSTTAFQKYLDDNYGIENVANFEFRTKEYGYNSFNQIIHLKNGEKIAQNKLYDYFEKGMHTGLLVHEKCIKCPFATVPRQADVTIGDFWGLYQRDLDIKDDLGVSLVLTNNDKGLDIVNSFSDGVIFNREENLEFAIRNNRFRENMKVPEGRHIFFDIFKKQHFNRAVKYALAGKYDIGIVGLFDGHNYGSLATYYALNHVIKNNLGLSVLMIEKSRAPLEKKIPHVRQMIETFYNLSSYYHDEEVNKINQLCDTFIVGSDQLWNVHLSRRFKEHYFLSFPDNNKKKISYATSFGIEYEGRSEETSIMQHFFPQFDHLSVRDDLSVRIFKDVFNLEAEKVCDPCLFCSAEDYDAVSDMVIPSELEVKVEKNNYIVAYILDPKVTTAEYLINTAKKRNMKIYLVFDLLTKFREEKITRLNLPDNEWVTLMPNIGEPEWLYYFKNASGIITDSFHGTIFSIIYKKPFISITNKMRGVTRFYSLVEPIGLKYRVFDEEEELFNNIDLLGRPIEDEVYDKLKVITDFSYNWLKNAIYAPKTYKSESVFPLIDENASENK